MIRKMSQPENTTNDPFQQTKMISLWWKRRPIDCLKDISLSNLPANKHSVILITMTIMMKIGTSLSSGKQPYWIVIGSIKPPRHPLNRPHMASNLRQPKLPRNVSLISKSTIGGDFASVLLCFGLQLARKIVEK